MATRRGDTLIFPKPPVIAAHACVGGKKEGESPLAAEFDELHSDNRLGQASWEAAETQLQLQTARLCLKKAHATEKDVSLLLAGDLQAQCTASGYAARALGLPFAGLFGACSTMAEALGVGACLCSAGIADGLLTIDTKDFISTIERASLIITERLKNPLRISFTEGKVVVRCQTNLGRVVDEFSAACEGDEVEIGFNNRYLLDALRNARTEQVRMEISGPLSPVKVLPVEGNDFLYLVLPVRFKND